MQNQRTKIVVIIAVILVIIVAVYGIWASLANKKNKLETAEEKMNREILLSLRVASNEPELSEEQRAAILFGLRSADDRE